MKTNHLLISTLLFLATFGAHAQGYINFSTRVTGVVVAHVYDIYPIGEPWEWERKGNTASETPAGTQVYLAAWIEGSGYTAQLWYAPGTGRLENELQLLAGSTTTFRTGATLGGTPAPVVCQVPGVVADTGIGTFQVRAWYNAGGTITSWNQVINPFGKSALFEVTNLGDGILTPPGNMVNFRSFNLYPLPEPGPLALFGLGALGLWVLRRGRRRR